jgi:hypothetical protein
MDLFRAQATIEYLVIIGVIVVIALTTVLLFMGLFDTAPQKIDSYKNSLNSSTQGAITISEAVLDVDGNGLLSVKNTSEDSLRIVSISLEGVEVDYNREKLLSGATKTFSLSDLGDACTCDEAQGSTSCQVIVVYVSAGGLTKQEILDIPLTCVSNATPANPSALITPLVPLDGVCGSAAKDYSFSESFPSGDYCSSGDANPSSPNNPAEGSSSEWICLGLNSGSDSGTCTATRESASSVSTCTQLREAIEVDCTANYTLVNDLDCVGEQGLIPICRGPMYSGVFDGAGHVITGLKIDMGGAEHVGFFGELHGATIKNIRLADANIVGGLGGGCNTFMHVGGLAGYADNGSKIINSSFSGTILGDAVTGGLVGDMYGGPEIINSYSTGSVSGCDFVGGFTGIMTQLIPSINNSYSSMSLTNSTYRTAGLAAWIGSVAFNNSFYSGTIQGTTSIGAVHGGTSGTPSISSFYWNDVPDDSATNCYPGGDTNCTKIDNNASYFYSHLDEPIASWGTWENVSGAEWATTDGNWSICEGAGYPWLTWENRSC